MESSTPAAAAATDASAVAFTPPPRRNLSSAPGLPQLGITDAHRPHTVTDNVVFMPRTSGTGAAEINSGCQKRWRFEATPG